MSNKCEHNNHSHFFLWWCVWLMWMNSCMDCTGERTRMKNEIRDLQYQVQQLNSKK